MISTKKPANIVMSSNISTPTERNAVRVSKRNHKLRKGMFSGLLSEKQQPAVKGGVA